MIGLLHDFSGPHTAKLHLSGCPGGVDPLRTAEVPAQVGSTSKLELYLTAKKEGGLLLMFVQLIIKFDVWYLVHPNILIVLLLVRV